MIIITVIIDTVGINRYTVRNPEFMEHFYSIFPVKLVQKTTKLQTLSVSQQPNCHFTEKLQLFLIFNDIYAAFVLLS